MQGVAIQDEQKARLVALTVVRGSAAQVARESGLAPATVARYARQAETDEKLAHLVQQEKERLGEVSLNVAAVLLGRMYELGMKSNNLRDVVGAYKVAAETGLLLKGDPTKIIREVEKMSSDQRQARIAELLAKRDAPSPMADNPPAAEMPIF